MTTFYGAGNGGFDASASQFAGGGFMPRWGCELGLRLDLNAGVSGMHLLAGGV